LAAGFGILPNPLRWRTPISKQAMHQPLFTRSPNRSLAHHAQQPGKAISQQSSTSRPRLIPRPVWCVQVSPAPGSPAVTGDARRISTNPVVKQQLLPDGDRTQADQMNAATPNPRNQVRSTTVVDELRAASSDGTINRHTPADPENIHSGAHTPAAHFIRTDALPGVFDHPPPRRDGFGRKDSPAMNP
jgi:hypothetical protein